MNTENRIQPLQKTTVKDRTLPFWKLKSLAEMTQQEWESLCDGCGQCCLIKLEDEETEELFVTNVACRMLDLQTCRCTDYPNRIERVPSCLVVRPDREELFHYLPKTCAYRRLHEGKDLPDWHPLISGNFESVVQAGVSVQACAVSESYIHPDQITEHVLGRLDENGEIQPDTG